MRPYGGLRALFNFLTFMETLKGLPKALGRTLMQEEEDGLDGKAGQERLESWLGLQQEVAA